MISSICTSCFSKSSICPVFSCIVPKAQNPPVNAYMAHYTVLTLKKMLEIYFLNNVQILAQAIFSTPRKDGFENVHVPWRTLLLLIFGRH